MKVAATEFKHRFGTFARMVEDGALEEVKVTRRGQVVGVYRKPSATDSIPFIGISTLGLDLSKESLNERG
jgi:hypothetical protein